MVWHTQHLCRGQGGAVPSWAEVEVVWNDSTLLVYGTLLCNHDQTAITTMHDLPEDDVRQMATQIGEALCACGFAMQAAV